MRGMNTKIKRPVDAFPKCPSCLSSCVSPIGIHVLCRVCGWDSLEAFADAGGYDTDASLTGAIAVSVNCRPSSLGLALLA